MTETEALDKMIAPGTPRLGKYRSGVIQVHVTRACNDQCFGCTQGSNLKGSVTFISPDLFEQAVISLRGYFGVVGVFGGNPALHPQFGQLCNLLKKHIPYQQRGLWCNNPLGKGRLMRETFNPHVSNLNVHLDVKSYEEFKRDWPESMPVGLTQDSRHSPPYVAMKDVIADESKRWDLISNCDINKHWSAMVGVFRGELRAWFCEVAGAQSILHQDEPNYPDTGVPIMMGYGNDGLSDFDLGDGKGVRTQWWRMGMNHFTRQVRKHCHDCGIPLRGYGELAQSQNGTEQVTLTHQAIYKPKDSKRRVALVTVESQLSEGRISNVTRYIQNANK